MNVSTVKRMVPPKCAEERAHFPGVPERVETFNGRESVGSSLACEGGPAEYGAAVPRVLASLSVLLLLGAAPTAVAQDLVFYGGETRPVAALAKVSAESGQDASRFEVTSLRDWAVGVPATFSGGELRVCDAEPVDRATLDAAFADLEQAVSFFDEDKAAAAFQTYESGLPCHDQPVPDEQVGRAYFLAGFVAYTSGDEALAAERYRAARSIHTTLRFDPNLPNDSAAVFEAAEPGVSQVRVEIRPTPVRVWVDGESRPYGAQGVEMVPGRHVVTIDSDSDATVLLDVTQAGAVILPSLLGTDVSAQIDPSRSRANLLQMLAYADVDKAWFTTLERTWVYDHNRLRELGVEEPVIEEARRRGRFTPAGLIVAGSGLVLGGVGAALFATRDDGSSAVPGIALMGAGGAALVTGTGIVVADQVEGRGHAWGITLQSRF